jgi:hypothetical protein
MFSRRFPALVFSGLAILAFSTCVTQAHEGESPLPRDLDGACQVIIVSWLDPQNPPLTIVMCKVDEDLNPFSDTDPSQPQETNAKPAPPSSPITPAAEPTPASPEPGSIDDIPPAR